MGSVDSVWLILFVRGFLNSLAREVADDMLKMSAVGDIGSAFSDWERGADELLELKAEEDGGATFTLSYLKDIINSAGVSSEVATCARARKLR